ncbi:putative serine carboxypeptidase-like 23 [Camellia sinensis]|uniref:putative serine carboxypeptidase-like 23 n=1 Tax=Camellia sinensis TaxID=4442 RepID=UPI001036C4E1|nr:putative serine carboxypeptidase-like 23 [Camellia sinensis]
MTEIGPFGVNPDVANILFVESPAGVGFSYSNTTSDYKVTADKRTELADTIIKRNKEVDPILMIQLKGIMIGNGIMNDRTDDIGTLDYAWSHSLISDETYRGLLNHCIMTPNDTKKCNDFIAREAKEIGYIDYYNIYGPTCLDSSNSDVDAVVPVTSTRYSIDALKLKVIKPWHPWTDDGEFQAAGYKVVYDELTFATVLGAGHQVPIIQPCRALALFKMFLAGN